MSSLSFPAPELSGVLVFVGVLLVMLFSRFKRSHTGLALPPGPKGWPIIGNLLDMSSTDLPWIVYREWSQRYGDLMTLKMLGSQMIIVNSADVALDLLDKRSNIYSDRPPSILDQLIGWDWNIAFMPYGQRWRQRRRLFHEYFHQNAIPKYRDAQSRAVRGFLQRAMINPGNIDPFAVRQTLATVVLGLTYGMEVTSMDDENVKLVTTGFEALDCKAPGRYWVDFLPFLRHIPAWMPGGAARKAGEFYKPIVERMKNEPFDAVKSGKILDACIVRDMISRITDHENDPPTYREYEECARDVAGIGYSAGVDTTYSLISSFLCAMAMRREVQKRARAELDTVIGPARLPDFEDCESLPYIQAIYLESSRWLPVVPLGVPHMVTVDDEYRGYFIPKGTSIVPNAWAMLHNPVDYPDPEVFNPDRFLKDGKINTAVRDPTTINFGFGRRICPGRYFAKENAVLTIASILHVFDIVPATDSHGQIIDPAPIPTVGLLSYPDRLPALKPRSAAAEQLVRSTM